MTTTAVAAAFLETQLSFTRDGGEEEMTFEDLPVPGIGPAGRKALCEGNGEAFDGGITNAAQVVGYYLRLNGNDADMEALLVDKCGCHRPSVVQETSGTLAALREKCEGAFVRPTADDSTVAAAAPEGTTQVFAGFMSKQLSWKDTFDSNPVPGLGAVGREKLKEADNIQNAAQLIGQYMLMNGDEDEFTEYLEECGIRKQEITKTNGILQAVQAKVADFCAP